MAPDAGLLTGMDARVETEPDFVDDVALRAGLERLAREPIDPRVGLFGPGSMFWEVNKHAIVYFAGAVQSVQMQLAHPWVAVGVFEHSKIMTDPRKRAQLTYTFLWSIIYGDLATVRRMSAALYKMHARVHGTIGAAAGRHAAGSAYRANAVSALLWVHVTAFYCRVKLYEKLVRALDEAEKDRFCAEAKRYAYCFGIPEDAHPSTWREVEAYVAAMQASSTLAPTEAGLRISRFLRDSIPRPARSFVWAFLCTSLPERTRAILELPEPTPANTRRSRLVTAVLRVASRVLPRKLAFVPAYHEAMARLAGNEGPGWLTAALNRAILGRSRLVSAEP